MNGIRKKAEEMGVIIVEKESIPNVYGASFIKNNVWHIIIDSSYPEERKNFTIAHELAEIMLYNEEGLTIDEKHHMANHIAGELLIPENGFKEAVYSKDLYQLKELYSECSYEVIARRMLRFKSLILTIYDNKRKYLRISSESVNYPSVPADKEIAVVEECYRLKDKYEENYENLSIAGYYIDNGNNVERVILLTEILDV